MAKQILIGIGIVLGVLFVGTLVVLHTSDGKEVMQFMRKLHGK